VTSRTLLRSARCGFCSPVWRTREKHVRNCRGNLILVERKAQRQGRRSARELLRNLPPSLTSAWGRQRKLTSIRHSSSNHHRPVRTIFAQILLTSSRQRLSTPTAVDCCSPQHRYTYTSRPQVIRQIRTNHLPLANLDGSCSSPTIARTPNVLP